MPAPQSSRPSDNSDNFNLSSGGKQLQFNHRKGENNQHVNYQNKNDTNPSQRAQSNAAHRNKPGLGSDSTQSPATKIDGDLVNVANENRVILNVGGIRHETYKVNFFFIPHNAARLRAQVLTSKFSESKSILDHPQEDSRY